MTTRRTFRLDEIMPLWMKYIYSLKKYADMTDPPAVMPLNEKFQRENLAGYVKNTEYRCLLIEENKKKIGFLFIGTGSQTNIATDYYIAELYIEKEYRRQRIAHSVMKSFFEEHPGRYCYFVINGNTPALSFWNRIINDFNATRLISLPDEGTPSYCTQYGFAVSIDKRKKEKKS